MSKFQAGWYVIYTMPHHEKKLQKRYAEIDLKSFLPTRKILRSWHDRRTYVSEPLFPSYIFLFLNNMQDYYNGIDSSGALYYVKTGSQIARVSDAVIHNLELLHSHNDELEVSQARFESGRPLVITKGALTGLSCEVVKYQNKEKLLVRVDLLNRNVLVSMPAECLAVI